jgi:hypothetical protein
MLTKEPRMIKKITVVIDLLAFIVPFKLAKIMPLLKDNEKYEGDSFCNRWKQFFYLNPSKSET